MHVEFRQQRIRVTPKFENVTSSFFFCSRVQNADAAGMVTCDTEARRLYMRKVCILYCTATLFRFHRCFRMERDTRRGCWVVLGRSSCRVLAQSNRYERTAGVVDL